jgi:hypothetical protein
VVAGSYNKYGPAIAPKDYCARVTASSSTGRASMALSKFIHVGLSTPIETLGFALLLLLRYVRLREMAIAS